MLCKHCWKSSEVQKIKVNPQKCFVCCILSAIKKVIQKASKSAMNQRFWRSIPGDGGYVFMLFVAALSEECVEISTLKIVRSTCCEFHYKIIEISSWIHTTLENTQTKTHTRDLCCVGLFFFLFYFSCVCRNVTGQWPWIPLFLPIPPHLLPCLLSLSRTRYCCMQWTLGTVNCEINISSFVFCL